MKNKRIMQAYDSINPGIADKQRMLDAILEEAQLTEKSRKTRKGKEPVIYTAKPTKTSKRSVFGALAACFAVVIFAGFAFAYFVNRNPIDPSYVEPSTEATAPIETVPVYTETLETYRRALDEGWDRTMCVENGISMLTPIESEYEGLYYAISDLDGNGSEELVISEYPYREDTDTSFLDIYTVLNGHVIQLMSLGDLDMRYLCKDGVVKDLTSPDVGEYSRYVSFWQIVEDQFVQDSAVYQKTDGQWITEGYRKVGAAITREEADEIVANYPPLKLDFLEIKSSGETKLQTNYEGFDHIIHKYVTALNEGWTDHRCEQNDISPQILSGIAGYQNLGWCLKDIDKNGVEELIISDGVYLYDLYVMMPHNGGPGHLICANGGETYQLCENDVIQKHGNYAGTSAWRYYTLADTELVQRDMVFYEGETNQYSYGTDDNSLNPISKEKAGDLLMRDRTAELTLTPFVEQPDFWPDESEYYEPLLNIYRQAVRERWNPGVCLENGISLMIGYYGELYSELGYTTMDMDNNGIQELIITDGNNIYDLYTIVSDETMGPLRLVDATERQQYFMTTDGLLYSMGSGGAMLSYHSLYTLGQRELVLQKGYLMDAGSDPNNPWYYYDGMEKGDPCPTSEAAAAMDAIRFADISFIPFE